MRRARACGKKGKSPDRGAKGGKAGACHVCGKTGHYAKDRWSKKASVNQVEEQTTATQSNPGGASSSSGQPGAAAVKMVRLETPPESRTLEVFDLTTPRDSDDDGSYPWRVGMVLAEEEAEDYMETEGGEEVFMDCIEPAVLVPDGTAIVALDLQDEEEELFVQMVRHEETEAKESCLITLDSGAGVSVLPRAYADVGHWKAGSQELRMIDAQGKRIAHDGVTKARLRTVDSKGKTMEMVEEFILGNVQHPILCAGKLLRKGWSICNTHHGLSLRNEEKDVSVPIRNEHNSLQFEANIFVVTAPESNLKRDNGSKQEARVMMLRGTLSKYVEELEMAPGWHRLPNGIVAYSDPVAVSMTDPRGQIEDHWKARLTLVKDADGMWSQVENIGNYMELGPTAFRKLGTGGPLRTLSFFAPSEMEDYWEMNSEVPIRPYPEERRREPQGRLDWSEDERDGEEELEMQLEAQDIEKMVVADMPDEIELDEVTYTEKMSVKELQMACKERELPHTGSKRRLLDKLFAFKINIENKLKLSIANKLFQEQQRKPMTLGQPKLPSLKDQEAHFVTHIPYAAWCQACVASRAKEDKHELREEKPDLGRNVIQLDFFFTYTGETRLQRGQTSMGHASSLPHRRLRQSTSCQYPRKDLKVKTLQEIHVCSKATRRGRCDRCSGRCNKSKR